MLWATSPACTELETHLLDWVADMLGLPRNFKSTGKGGGVIQDSASSAALCAILAARERGLTGLEIAVHESQPAILAFYRGLGFEPVGEEKKNGLSHSACFAPTIQLRMRLRGK